MTALWIIGAVLALVLILRPKGKHSSGSSTPRSGWIIGPIVNGKNYSVGMPARPTPLGGGWYFDFPKTGKVDYVQNFSPPPLDKSITIRYRVTGSGWQAEGDVARVGLHFQRRGDDWSGAMPSYRWYSRNRPVLQAGEFTLTVPLELSAWGDVYAKGDQAGFDAALRDLECIAVVFGGQFAGHGVSASEPSRFTLLSCG